MSSKFIDDEDDEYEPEEDIEEEDDDEPLDISKKIKIKTKELDVDDIDDLEEDDEEDIDDINNDIEDDDEDIDDMNDDEEPDELVGGSIKTTVPSTAKTNFPNFDDLNDDDEDDDENDNYLQKFDENLQKNIISEFHPELRTYNYDEIDVLSRVVRDENGVVIDELHKTLPFITRYEKARVLGERAKQINSGARSFIEVEPNMIDGYLIALEEFNQKKIPFIVSRPLPNGGVEHWRLSDLEILA